jgi:membrane associated rhomboid family serine protease
MPRCVECQKETPRDEMRGAPDDLRCPACAAKYTEKYYLPRRAADRQLPPVVTGTICVAAIIASLVYWQFRAIGMYLVADSTAVYSGQLWRLLTDALPHVSVIHLAFNLYWTWRWGQVLEGWLGPVRFAGLVLLLAGGSSAVAFLGDEPGIGLSGVGFGLLGLLFALRHDKDFAAQEMQPGVIQLWVAWFFFCIVATYMNFMAVGNIAHGAGAALGWLVGRAVMTRRRVVLLSLLSFLSVALMFATLYMPWSGRYAYYRGEQCAKQHDYVGALYWYEKAQRAFPDNPQLGPYIEWLRQETRQENRERSRER